LELHPYRSKYTYQICILIVGSLGVSDPINDGLTKIHTGVG